jgi:hypothetical protein
MMWFLRFLLWATLLAYPCLRLAGTYQRLLLGTVSVIVGVELLPDARSAPDLAAANMVGLYVAMCLATTSAPRHDRWRAVLIGITVLTGLECATALASFGLSSLEARRGPWPATARAVFEALSSVPRLGAGPAVWLFTLGRWTPWMPTARFKRIAPTQSAA